jgi:ABC-type Mn2+/Zn2+ transport system ATPase subunit
MSISLPQQQDFRTFKLQDLYSRSNFHEYSSKPILEVQRLGVQRIDKPILNDVNVSCNPGDKVVIRGKNGSGKTTFLLTLLGMVPFSQGSIRWFSQDIRHRGWKKLRHRIAYLNQLSLTPDLPLTVREVVELGFLASSAKPPKHLTKKEKDQIVMRTLQLFGSESLVNRGFTELSGGQQQRVNLARVLVQQPQVLLLDEPAASQDPESKLNIIELLDALHEHLGTTIIMTSHDETHFNLVDWIQLDLVEGPGLTSGFRLQTIPLREH